MGDSTQRLKAWASVSQQLRFSQRVHRLTVAPPAGISLVRDKAYRQVTETIPARKIFMAALMSLSW